MNNLKNKLCNKLIQEGIATEGDIVKCSYTKQIMEGNKKCIERNDGNMITLTTRPDCLGVVVKENKSSQEMTKELIEEVKSGKYNDGNVYSKHLHQSSNFDDKPKKELSATIEAGNMDTGIINRLRIRKLTPKECFRLMGVKDQDFDKVAKNQSDSSLYHLAGDSIVIQCLEAILKELL